MHDTAPFPPLPHQAFVRSRTPTWLSGASADQREYLKRLAMDAENARHDLKQALGALQAIEGFALQRLRPLLASLEHAHVDPEQAVLYWTDPQGQRPPIQRSLLHAALQNFHRNEALANAYGAGSGVFGAVASDGKPDPATLLDLAPERFAQACRSLNVGGDYQEALAVHIPAHVPSAGTAITGVASLAELVLAAKRNAFVADACVARLNGRLSEQGEALLGQWQLAPLTATRAPAKVYRLELLGFALARVLVFTQRTPETQGAIVVAYLPGDPAGSVTEYADASHFVRALRQRLADPAFLTFFSGFVPLDQRLAFSDRVNAALAPGKWLPSHLTWTAIPINGDPFVESYRIWAQQTLADAATVAVPTALVDHRDSFGRYAHWVELGEQLGLTLTLMVGSAIPGVNVIAEAVMLGQSLYGVYEGVQAWGRGDTHNALECLFGAVENVGFIGLGKRPKPEAQQFAAGLIPVMSGDGQVRLWRPSLDEVRAHDVPPEGTPPDVSGRYTYSGRAWVQIDGAFYEVDAGATATHAPIIHPQGKGYAPVLQSDGAGAWRAAHENPADWNSSQLIRRFNHRYQTLSEHSLMQAQTLAGVTPEQLQQAHLDGRPMPAPLAYLLNRRLALGQVEAAIRGLREQGAPGKLALPLVESLLAIPGWPEGLALEFQEPDQAHTLGQTGSLAPVHLSQTDLVNGRWAARLIAQLDTEAHDALLGTDTSLVPAEQAQQVLADAWANTLERQRQPWVERLTQTGQPTDVARSTLRRQFPGLTGDAVEVLMRDCTREERQALEAGRVPPGMGEQAAEALRQLRLARVCDAVFEGIATADRDRVAIGLFTRLGSWTGELRLELRDQRFTGPLLESTGDPTARRWVIVRHGTGYQAFDDQGLELSPVAGLEQALFAALPDSARAAAAPGITDATSLRYALTDRALQDRDNLRRLLGMIGDNRRFFKPPARHANGSVGYALSGRGAPAPSSEIVAAMNRVALEALFPDVPEAELAELEAELGEGEAATASLARLNADLARLRLELDQWIARADDNADENAPIHEAQNRALFAEHLVNLWQRRQTTRRPGRHGYGLVLRSLPVSELPPLSVRFTHARRLALLDMDLQRVSIDFLAAFPNLTWLDLSMNNLIELPDTSQLTQLERLSLDYTGNRQGQAVLDTITPHAATLLHLDLAGIALTLTAADFQRLRQFEHLHTLDMESNAITLTQDTVAGFDQLTSLENLSLSYNPLERAPVVAHLTRLGLLELTNTQLRDLPPGLVDLMDREPLHLHEVNLSDNQIEVIPDFINTRFVQRVREGRHDLASPYYGMGMNLDGNPLLPESRQMLRDAGLGFFEQGALSNSELSDEFGLPQENHWLEGCPLPLRQAILAERTRHEAREFYQLLSRVVDTEDYRTAPQQTRQRVWALVQTWLQPGDQVLPGLEALRDRLFSMAQDTMGTCGDGVALTLDDMEFEVEGWRILARSQAPGDGPLIELLQYQRRLWRRVLVDDIARRIVRAREARRLALQSNEVAPAPSLDPLDHLDDERLDAGIDEVEVRLYLIQQLEQVLNLPPSRGMRYSTYVSRQTITDVGAHVLAQDSADDFAQWVAYQPGFRPYLENARQQRFEHVRERWQAAADYLYGLGEQTPEAVPTRPAVLDALPAAVPEVQWPEQGTPQLSDQQLRLAYDWITQQQRRELDALALQLTRELLGLQLP